MLKFLKERKKWNLFLISTNGAIGSLYYKNQQTKNQQAQEYKKNIQQYSFSSLENTTIKYNLKSREDNIKNIEKQDYDVLIIGGGANGAGVALDASSRGLKCLVIEKSDFASGASSKSTKLIHGGVRYLQEAFSLSLMSPSERLEKLKLVINALKERSYFIENAYYMNKYVPFIIPASNLPEALFYYIGCSFYHGFYLMFKEKDSQVKCPFPTLIGYEQMHLHFPLLDDKFSYGVQYYDGQFNDSRMNMDILLTSSIDKYQNEDFKSADMINYMSFEKFTKDQEGKIIGGEIKDQLNDKQYQIKAKCVVNCTGCFADTIRKMDDSKCQKRILPVEGTHLTLPKQFGSKSHSLLIPKTSDGRVLFAIPWQKHIVLGTTDKKYDEPTNDPKVDFENHLWIMTEFQKYFSKAEPLQISKSVKSKWAGLRPLVLEQSPDGAPVDTKRVSRNHVIEKTNSGLISLMGGKWTTYREMAEETVDEVVKQLKIDQNKYKCSTRTLKLLGSFHKSQSFPFQERKTYLKLFQKKLQNIYDINDDIAKNLIKQYGERAFDVLSLSQENQDLKQRIVEGHPFIKAEIIYSIRYEMAMKPQDILFRRTRLGFLDSKAMQQSIRLVVDCFAKELNWDQQKTEQEFQKSFTEIAKLDF